MKYIAIVCLTFYLTAVQVAVATPTAEPVQYSSRLPTPKSLTSAFSSPQTIQAAAINNGEPLINRAAIEWTVIFGLSLCAGGLFVVRRRRHKLKN